MSRKSRPTPMTPEIQAQIEKWAKWLETMHDVRFHPSTDITFKASVVVKTGHCPCRTNRICPCPEVTDELKRDGTCFCHVFCTKDFAATLKNTRR